MNLTLRTTLGTLLPAMLVAATIVACTGNPEGADRRRAPTAATQLPEGHVPVGEGQVPVPLGTPANLPPGVAASDPDEEGRVTVAGVEWQAVAPLVYQVPSSQMRAAEYTIEGGDDATVLTVFHFPGGGGGIQANIDRWVGQMTVSEDRPAEISRSTVGGMSVTKLDVHGGFGGMQMPGAPTAAGAVPGSRMLGAIVEGPNGPLFFKMVGPEATVDLAADAFDGLIASFRSAS